MGLIEFFILILIVVALCYLTTIIAAKLAPNHPPVVDWIIWFVGILIIIVALANAMGLVGYDPRIPRIR